MDDAEAARDLRPADPPGPDPSPDFRRPAADRAGTADGLRPRPARTPPGDGGIFWCDLDESTADAAIAAAVDEFRPHGNEWEWKHYGYDRPADLTDRLRAAGFEPDDEEALVIGETAVVRERLAGAPSPTASPSGCCAPTPTARPRTGTASTTSTGRCGTRTPAT